MNRVQRMDKLSPRFRASLLFAAALGLRLYGLGTQSLWFDEIYTWFVARLPWQEGWQFLVADGVHPPLFYWLFKLWLAPWGPHPAEWILRFPSALIGAASVPALYFLGRRWFGENTGLLAALLLAVSPFNIWYSQEARMYSLVVLLAILVMGLYGLARQSGSRRIWGAFLLASACGYMVHYFALLLPLVQFTYILRTLRQNPRFLRQWTLVQVLAALPLLGWVGVLANRPGQFFGIGWVPPVELRDLLLTLVNFTVGVHAPIEPWHWWVMFACLALAIVGLLRQREEANLGWLAGAWAFLPLVVVFFISIRRPVYVDRFLVLAQPAFLLCTARGVFGIFERNSARKEPPIKINRVLAAPVLLAFLLVGSFVAGWIGLFLGPEKLEKENWREAFAALSTRATSKEVIVTRTLQHFVPLAYYYAGDAPAKALEVNRIVSSLEELTAGAAGTWLVMWNPQADAHSLASAAVFDPAAEQDKTVRQWLAGQGPPLVEQLDFQGVTILYFRDH